MLIPNLAYSHVKWFSDFDLKDPPREIFSVASNPNFLLLLIVTSLIIFVVTYVDRKISNNNQSVKSFLFDISYRCQPHLPLVLRLGVAGFLVAVSILGGTILTPELTTDWPWINWVQIALAATLIFRRTSFLCGLGIIGLFAFSISEHGLFHTLDYPIFLGIAAYLIIDSLLGPKKTQLATAILRVAAGSTLLWASIEKWAFPDWSFDILEQQPALTLGIDWELYMLLAGFVEFCAAFLVITGKLSARLAIMLLIFFFLSAIPPFGIIDAIGHSGIIVVLFILLFSVNTVADNFDVKNDQTKTALLHTCWYVVALLGYSFAYYGGYHIEYDPYPQSLAYVGER